MMKTILFAWVLLLTTPFAFAQLKGSGKTVTRKYSYNQFDKVNFNNLDGAIAIEAGKPFSISVTIDDNLAPLLLTEQSVGKTLTIALKGNRNNRLYIEDTKIKIMVTMPVIVAVSNNGNADLLVSKINGDVINVKNLSNGNMILEGMVDHLEAINLGNGKLDATTLKAKTASIVSSGNGDVITDVLGLLTPSKTGNGKIINVRNNQQN